MELIEQEDGSKVLFQEEYIPYMKIIHNPPNFSFLVFTVTM